jgi:DNA-binding GntR family transcriptional regulator
MAALSRAEIEDIYDMRAVLEAADDAGERQLRW